MRLTASGTALVDRLIEVHLANVDRLLDALEPEERTALGELLGTLALSLEA